MQLPLSPLREQLIDAVVPAIVIPRPAPAPIALLPAPVRRASSDKGLIAIDVARMDRSGRVRAAQVLRALDWLPGSGIDLDVAGGAIVIHVEPAGRHFRSRNSS